MFGVGRKRKSLYVPSKAKLFVISQRKFCCFFCRCLVSALFLAKPLSVSNVQADTHMHTHAAAFATCNGSFESCYSQYYSSCHCCVNQVGRGER